MDEIESEETELEEIVGKRNQENLEDMEAGDIALGGRER